MSELDHSWARQLGHVPTLLFGRETGAEDPRHLALLDGVRASFLISDDATDATALAADWAWSSDVRHHVLLKQQQIVVTRATGSTEIFERRSVESKLNDFLKYLEADSDAQKIVGAIDHLITLFRRHRTTLRQWNKTPPPDLQSFLYLLLISQEPDVEQAHREGDQLASKYALDNFDAGQLSDTYVLRFVEEVRGGSASQRRLLTPLTVRHAGGALFQEAQAEILAAPMQMTLFGLADASRQRLDLSRLGVYYTPPGLARTLAEIAIQPHLQKDVIKISDPACGSGIFLCEAIRTLQRYRYSGKVILHGRDISTEAVQMAKFSVACAAWDWKGGKVECNIDRSDFLDSFFMKMRFDVILMNPPFLSWESLTSDQRKFVREVLGDKYAGRPDLSMAFVQRALSYLSSGGTLATLLPRGVLDSHRGQKWREGLLASNDVRLIGTFGEHGLFRHAMVSIGAAVFERKRTNNATTVMIWSDERAHSAESALRALRRQRSKFQLEDDRSSPNWSIYSTKSRDLAVRKSWLPTPNALGSTLELIRANEFPRIQDLFAVRQGIKTGMNEAFIISNDELRALPAREQRCFRRVANGEDIAGGRIHSSTHIFYVPKQFQSKRQMLETIPVFGKKLLSNEVALKKRYKADPLRWWEASRARMDLAARTPRIMTKMFGGLNMAAVDAEGQFLPLQAYAWMPTERVLKVGDELIEAALWWYCRILNSTIFFLLRREYAAALTSGGQLDVSPKYVNDVPMPTPTRDELVRLMATRDPDVSASQKNDEAVAASYGTTIDSWPRYAGY